mgnify:CR=1 FL=1
MHVISKRPRASLPSDGTGRVRVRKRKEPQDRSGTVERAPRPKKERDPTRPRERTAALPALDDDSVDPFERYRRMTGQPVEQIYNRDGFRYMLAELDPVLKDQARERLDSVVCLSREDRSASITLSRDRLSAWSEKGTFGTLVRSGSPAARRLPSFARHPPVLLRDLLPRDQH